MGPVFTRIPLILLIAVALVGSSYWVTSSAEAPSQSLQLFTVEDYGRVIVASLNRSLLHDLGNGYWLLLTPNATSATVAKHALNAIGFLNVTGTVVYSVEAELGPGGYRILGERAAPGWGTPLDVSPLLDSLIGAQLRLVDVNVLSAGEGYVVRIDAVGDGRLQPHLLAERLRSVLEASSPAILSIVVLEAFGTVGSSVPSVEGDQGLYSRLQQIPCFTSISVSIYGASLVFGASCISERASRLGTTFEEELDNIVASLKALDPLLRKHMKGNILVHVAKEPARPVPDILVVSPGSGGQSTDGIEEREAENKSASDIGTEGETSQRLSGTLATIGLAVLALTLTLIIVTARSTSLSKTLAHPSLGEQETQDRE